MKISYTKKHKNTINFGGKLIHSFLDMNIGDIDAKTVKSFGEEWSKFSSFSLSPNSFITVLKKSSSLPQYFKNYCFLGHIV